MCSTLISRMERSAPGKSKGLFSLIFLLILTSCASNRPSGSGKTLSQNNDIQIDPRQMEIQPGKVKFVQIDVKNLENPELICRDKTLPSLTEDSRLKAFISESYFSKMKPFKCYIESRGKKYLAIEFNVVAFPYKQERLHVDKKRVFLSEKNLARVKRERKILAKVYKSEFKHPLFDDHFVAPLDSYITSHYGTKRIYNNKKHGQHLGNDFRAKVGVPIPVTNTGKVVLVKNLFYSGNTVIVDHGLGVFTTYGHLSRFKVGEGDIVQKGSIVGLSGATGRVSGPHLHWGVKVHGNWVDGFSLVKNFSPSRLM